MHCKLAQAMADYAEHTRRIVSRDSVRVWVKRSSIIGGRIRHCRGRGSDAEVCDSRVAFARRERLVRRQPVGKAPHDITIYNLQFNIGVRVSVFTNSIVVVDRLFADSSHACGI